MDKHACLAGPWARQDQHVGLLAVICTIRACVVLPEVFNDGFPRFRRGLTPQLRSF
jgi:hypothetical protein